MKAVTRSDTWARRIDRADEMLADLLDRHFPVVWFIFISILALLIRLTLFDNVSGDASVFLLPWYGSIREGGGFSALSGQTGNYTMLYQTFIALITYLPIEPLYAYKILSCLFDFLLAFAAGRIAYESGGHGRVFRGLVVYGTVLLSPVVFLNSAYWAQCDSIYVFFCVAALGCLTREKYARAFILYGLAFAIKLQAILLLPFFLFAWVRIRRVRLRHFLLIPLSVMAASIPGLLCGRRFADIFSIYSTQILYYPRIALNSPSFWLILDQYDTEGAYQIFRYAAILLAIGTVAAQILIWQRSKLSFTVENAVRMAFLTSYTCVLLLPAMHERYGYLYEVLSIILVCFDRRSLPLAVTLHLVTLTTYGSFLFGQSSDLRTLAVVNVLIYTLYSVRLNRQMRRTADESPPP